MPRGHALLAPSAAHRWMECPKAPALEKNYPDRSSPYAQEGTQAHDVCEKLLENRFKGACHDIKADADMKANAQIYVDYIEEIYNEEKAKGVKPVLHVEERLDLGDYIPRCFGFADAILEGKDTLHVFDFKYGKGVQVFAEENPQLKIYALGAERALNYLDDYETIRLHIIQPRLDHIDSAEYSTDELLRWGNEVLKPAANRAFRDQGEFHPGSHCQFCKARNNCKTRQESLMAQIEDAKQGNQNLAYILEHASEWEAWIRETKENALQRALDGDTIPGFKLVEGRSNRKIQQPEQVASLLQQEGFDPYKPRELKTLTALEKEVGRKRFGELCSDYLIKPQGKPTLVPESDKRPALNSAESDFEKLED